MWITSQEAIKKFDNIPETSIVRWGASGKIQRKMIEGVSFWHYNESDLKKISDSKKQNGITKKQALEILNFSYSNFRSYVAKGRIKKVKIHNGYHNMYDEKSVYDLKYSIENKPPSKTEEYYKEWRKHYRLRNLDKIKRFMKEYSKNNRHLYRKKYKEDFSCRIRCVLSAMVTRLLTRKGRKSIRTLELLGCDYDFFISHLKNNFKSNHSFENYGKVWELDHIIPCNAFDLNTTNAQKICFNYKNYQPLDKIENIKKKDNITIETLLSLPPETIACLKEKWQKLYYEHKNQQQVA